MIILSAFLLVLFFISLISNRLKDGIITMPMIFTLAGMVFQLATPAKHALILDRPSFLLLSALALSLILFTDSTRIGMRALRGSSSMPVRLLSIGMPLTILLGAILAMLMFPSLSLWEAGIVAAILAPTDASLGGVVVKSPHVPTRIRQALDVEAGLNDGLSVPFLMLFVAVALSGPGGALQILLKNAFEQIILGALIGAGLGLAGGWLLDRADKRNYASKEFGQYGLMSIPILCLIAAEALHSSPFIAAYIGGLFVQACFKDASQHVLEFSEQWGQLLNFLIFFNFGIILVSSWEQIGPASWIYAIASLTAVRMIPTALALAGTHVNRSTVLFMGWFGPRGLASLVLGLVFVEQESNLPGEPFMRSAVIATVLLSIFAHGFTARTGIDLYSRKVRRLDADVPERKEVV